MQLNLARLLALSMICVSPAWSQDQEETAKAQVIDEMEPAVSTSGLAAAEPAADDGERRVDPALAQGVTRHRESSGVMDRMDLGRTEITGNQELPKVLYIVPWQKPGPAELMGKPVNTLLDEVLAPIDRTEFVRQVDYYDELYGDEQE